MDNFKAKSVHESIEYLSYMLDTNKKVFYMRFGDGVLCTMAGERTKNHNSSPKLIDELKEFFLIDDELFIKAGAVDYPILYSPNTGYTKYGPFVESSEHGDSYLHKMREMTRLTTDEREFCSSVLFQYLSVYDPKALKFFIDNYIKPKKKMFIGSNNQGVMESLYGEIDFYVKVPERNAYGKIDEWWPEVEENFNECEVIIPAAGVATKVIAKRLWNLGAEVHCFDTGSINDAIEGKETRVWIKIAGADNIRKNLL